MVFIEYLIFIDMLYRTMIFCRKESSINFLEMLIFNIFQHVFHHDIDSVSAYCIFFYKTIAIFHC